MTDVPPTSESPGAAPPRDPVAQVVEELERRLVPQTADLDTLVMTALQMYAPETARRGRDLIRRWRANGCTDPDLDLAEGLLAVAGASSSTLQRLQAMGDISSPEAAAEAVNRVFRGEIRAAMDLAQAHGWFLDDPDLTEPLCLVLLAAAMDGATEEAEVILRAWKRRWPGMAPEKVVSALQCEARVAYFQHQYGRELSAVLDAMSLAGQSGLAAAKVFVEPALAGAYLHNGEFDRAQAIMSRWPGPSDAAGSPLQALHDMVRVDAQLLAEQYDEAWNTARRYVRFGEAMNNMTLQAEGRFYCVMSAPASHFDREVNVYRRVAYRHQLRRHLSRLKILDGWLRRGAKEVRTARVGVRFRHQEASEPLVRLWMPRMEWVGTDLFVDRIQGQIHLSGDGPFSLARRRVLQRMLDAILASGERGLRTDELFAQVWGGVYDPLTHEGRIHVNVHRLRRWFEECRPGGEELLEVHDGVIHLASGVDVCSLDLPDGHRQPATCPAAHERVVQCLIGDGTLSPGQIQRMLGVSRSQINRTVRVLMAEGRIERTGAGRSTRYRIAGGKLE